MLFNYLKIAFRNLARNKGYSFINIGGLAVGMAVAMLIGLWVYDELTYDRYHENHDKIAAVWRQTTSEGEIDTGSSIPLPLEDALRHEYGNFFKHIVMSDWNVSHSLAYGEKKFTENGSFMGKSAPEMLDLRAVSGERNGLQEPNSIMLDASIAQSLFGKQEPIGKTIMLDGEWNLKVTGVYEDIAANSSFNELCFIVPWSHFVQNDSYARRDGDNWGSSNYRLFVQTNDNVSATQATEAIKEIIPQAKVRPGSNPKLFLHPMNDWHLHSDFENGVQTGGRIQYVRLFGIIGGFVLLLASINYINLSTARSEKRAKEVGIRKSVGSLRRQLVGQFLSESFLVVILAFGLALMLVMLSLTTFNNLAEKQIALPWTNVFFWGIALSFICLTALLSGSYPALYLSSFQPVKVLKGARFQVGRYAGLPRKVLVVLQFTVSVALIIGTIIVFRQINHTKDRPIGYDRSGLVQVHLSGNEFQGKYNFMRQELINSGAVVEMATSNSPTTALWNHTAGYSWQGKPEGFQERFAGTYVSHDYAKTLGLKLVAGRDFSREFTTDSSGIIINQTAVKYMSLADPVGTILYTSSGEESGKIIGVVEDMIMESPYEVVEPTLFFFDRNNRANYYNLRLAPGQSTSKSLAAIGSIFSKNFPDFPFDYQFVDDEYAAKFAAEERIGKLAGVFTGLAILISCLGLFGLASYVAEQRTKEIGVRKVLGASVASLWRLLSKDFVLLVLIALLIAAPLAWYFMDGWLQKYTYRTELSWWIFAAAGAGALAITLLTVSFQAVKAALMNPVESLRSE